MSRKSIYNYTRRKSSVAKVGSCGVGVDNPVRLQSMTNTVTVDSENSAAQIIRIADAGGEIVRLTTQGIREAANMRNISAMVKQRGYDIPLVADVHFNPKAAYEAAKWCEKVRINPGNFVDPARTFRSLEDTDEEYAAELVRIREALMPLVQICKENATALRLGVNHGSLSDRIMSRFGDTPQGMTESAMEFLRILRELDFHDVIISIKASNVVVMTQTVRLLCERMDKEGMNYPLHLGVTEAGDGEDGRIKSAVGIGTLLQEGFGDTVRVSLSEAPEAEIPVAKKITEYISRLVGHKHIVEPYHSEEESRSNSLPVIGFEGIPYPLVFGIDFEMEQTEGWHFADASEIPGKYDDDLPVVLESYHVNRVGEMASWIDRFVEGGGRNPVILKLAYDVDSEENFQVQSGVDLGCLLLNGYGRGVWLEISGTSKKLLGTDLASRTALGILQAVRLRISKTEYIACPGCGRTLFDLPATLKEVKRATQGMQGLKIGVMGCIVNGPGEMADADYGYVGAGVGRVSIYRGKEMVKKNLPPEEALPELLALIEKERKG